MAMHTNAANIQCRTCFDATKESHLLDSMAFDEISFAELLNEVEKYFGKIQIMDDKNRLLPQHICECCSRKLKMSHTFIKQAQEVNSRLCALLYQNHRQDCLEEFEIDIQQCLDIKLYRQLALCSGNPNRKYIMLYTNCASRWAAGPFLSRSE